MEALIVGMPKLLTGNRKQLVSCGRGCPKFRVEAVTTQSRAMRKFGVRGSGGLLLLGLNGLAVAEAHTLDDLGEALRTIQPAPAPLGRLSELENHRQRGLA